MARLANAEQASIDPRKLHSYLLSRAHQGGRFKAVFFAALGFTTAGWTRLEVELLRHVRTNDAVLAEKTPFGQKYEVQGMIHGPNGRSAMIVAIWIVLDGETTPKFVTAYPGEAR